MGKNKLKRFAENAGFEHVFQPAFEEVSQDAFPLKGHWADFFGNVNPITLELACGRGEYSIGLAELYPQRNFVGMDVKGARLWRGARTAHERNWKHVAFVRQHIGQLHRIFSLADAIDEVWIVFPDPQLRDSKSAKRLTSPRFLSTYRKCLAQTVRMHLKTDSKELFEFTLETIEQQKLKVFHSIPDVHAAWPNHPELGIRTFYESMWLEQGRTIYYLCFELGTEPCG
jgi:tRNA (guanine-N7-)-methyltransferase